jgi:hypothetical protein
MAGYWVVNDGAFEKGDSSGNIDYDYGGSYDFRTNNDPNRLDADGIMIRRADSPPLNMITYVTKSPSLTQLTVCSPSDFKFEPNNILIIKNSGNYRTVQVQAVSPNPCASGNCEIDVIASPLPYQNPSDFTTIPDATWQAGTVAKFAEIAYFIDPNGPVLKRSKNGQQAKTLAENIEDLQIAYQLSGDATWYDTLSPTQQVQDIRSVRINVLARTDKMDPHFSGKRRAIEDHAEGNADKYRRRLLTTVINVRNMGL